MLIRFPFRKKPQCTDVIERILLEAADLVSERGLAKCKYMDNRGRVCALGAIRLSTYWIIEGKKASKTKLKNLHLKYPECMQAESALFFYLNRNRKPKQRLKSIGEINDNPAMTVRHMRNLLRAAASTHALRMSA